CGHVRFRERSRGDRRMADRADARRAQSVVAGDRPGSRAGEDPVPRMRRADLDAALARVGAPAILKTRREGYDGKGQFRIKKLADVDAAWQALGAQAK